MIINGETLLSLAPIKDMLSEKVRHNGVSHGLTECGYDIRIKQGVWLFPGRSFVLASSLEEFDMPTHLMGRVLNKSTWARRGIDASMTTNIEPGWKGWLTLELCYRRWRPIYIPEGTGIAQVIFENVLHAIAYQGKYQHQPNEPTRAR